MNASLVSNLPISISLPKLSLKIFGFFIIISIISLLIICIFQLNSYTKEFYLIQDYENTLNQLVKDNCRSGNKLGYYSLPRKTNSEQLAKKLNLHKSALAAHRRKAELRLITQILIKQGQSIT